MFNWELSFNLGKAVGLARLNSSAFCMYTFLGDSFPTIFDIFAQFCKIARAPWNGPFP